MKKKGIKKRRPQKFNAILLGLSLIVLLLMFLFQTSIKNYIFSLDFDGDSLLNGDELQLYNTNPFSRDTDNDGLTDDFEVGWNRAFTDSFDTYFLDPTNPDTDNDGLIDSEDLKTACQPSSYSACLDRDNDGLDDNWEYWEFGCMSLQYQAEGYIVRPTGLIVDPVTHLSIQAHGLYSTHAKALIGHEPPYTDAELSILVNNRNLWAKQDCVLEERTKNPYPDNIIPFSSYSDVGCFDSPDVPNKTICPAPDLVEFTWIDDPDGDGCPNWCEQIKGTEPIESLLNAYPDSDNDGLPDGAEVNTYHSDPLNPDTDGDGLMDGQEVIWYTAFSNADCDVNGDGILYPQDTTDTVLNNDPSIRSRARYSLMTNRAKIAITVGYSDPNTAVTSSRPLRTANRKNRLLATSSTPAQMTRRGDFHLASCEIKQERRST